MTTSRTEFLFGENAGYCKVRLRVLRQLTCTAMSLGLLDAVKTPTHRERASNSTCFRIQLASIINLHMQIYTFSRVCAVYLNAIVTTQLLCVQSRAVDGVECKFNSSREERGDLREKLIVLRFHGDCFDEHWVTSIFVRFQL